MGNCSATEYFIHPIDAGIEEVKEAEIVCDINTAG